MVCRLHLVPVAKALEFGRMEYETLRIDVFNALYAEIVGVASAKANRYKKIQTAD